jgi:hypothetical protein
MPPPSHWIAACVKWTKDYASRRAALGGVLRKSQPGPRGLAPAAELAKYDPQSYFLAFDPTLLGRQRLFFIAKRRYAKPVS